MIPEDWKLKKCGEVGSFYKGKGISSKDLVADGLPCIMYGDIYVKYDTKFSNPDFRITKQTAINSSLAKTGDLFFTGSGETAEEIGKCVVYQGNDDIYIGGDIIALTPNSDNDSLFLAYMQNSKMLLSQKANLGQGHTVVHIYTEHIKSLNMPLPPTKAEQTAIATALSDADALIIRLEKLIAKKRNIKQGAMQELLTGKKRLPGFSGKWEVKKVHQFGEVITGSTPSTQIKEFWNGNIPWVTPTDISDKKDIYTTEREITDKGLGSIRRLPPNSVLITCIASIGKNVILRKEGACNQQINAIIPNKKNVAEFLYYLMESSKQYLLANAGITATNIISKRDFAGLSFKVPLIEEQNTIAQILSDMDVEIEQLEQKLDKYRMIKQGMMQELLTGKTRLI